MHLHTGYMEFSEHPSTLSNPLLERACFSQVCGGGAGDGMALLWAGTEARAAALALPGWLSPGRVCH